MKKKHWILISSASAALILIIGIVLLYPAAEKSRKSLDQVLPMNAAAIIKINNIQKLLDFAADTIPMNQNLLKINGVKKFMQDFLSPEDSLRRSKLNELLLEKNQCDICLVPSDKNGFSALALVEESILAVSPTITNFLDNENLNRKKNGGHSYYVGFYGGDSIYLAHPYGYFLASKDEQLILATLNRFEDKTNNLRDSSLIRILNTSNKNAMMNILVHHPSFKNMFKSLKINGLDNYMTGLVNFGSWTGWDLTFTSNEIFLTGFTISDSTNALGMNYWMKSEPGSGSLAQAIPGNHLSHVLYHFNPIKEITAGEAEATWNATYKKGRNSAIKKWQKDGLYKMEERFYDLMGKDFAFVRTAFNEVSPGENRFIVCEIKSTSETEKYIEDFFYDYAVVIKGSPGNFMQSFPIDESTAFKLYRFPYERLGYVLFGSMFKEFESNWIAVYQNYLIIAEDDQSLGNYLTELFRRNTLKNNTDYAEFSSNLSDEFRATYYVNLWRSLEYLKYPLHKDWPVNLFPASVVKNFQAACMQVGTSESEGMLSNDIVLLYNPNIVEKPQTIWELALDTVIHTKPAIVINHTNNTREILVQDLHNKIYLINYAGRILWEKQLDSKIISKIYQVDYFKNKKLQYLFNTENQIHLIDRNGDYVGRYPVFLPNQASNGLSIFKTGEKAAVKYVIALEDLSVRVFNLDGNSDKDWKTARVETAVLQEVQFIYDRKKPLLAYHDNNRLYIMNLKGEEAFSPAGTASPSNNPLFLQEDERTGKKYLIYTDIQGTILEQSLGDELRQLDYLKCSENHHFMMADVNADGDDDFIFTDGKTLSVFTRRGQVIYSKTFDGEIAESPSLYQFSRGINKLGIVTEGDHSIHLLNADGSYYPGFPLKGYTSFSISSLQQEGRFTLLVGGASGYLYHYGLK